MTQAPKISMYLLIDTNDPIMDFDECTDAIGVVPTFTSHNKLPSVPGSAWGIGFEERELYSTNHALAELLSMISPYKDRIKQFAYQKGYSVEVVCTVTILENPPMYELSPSYMKELVDLNAEFLLDIYNYSRY